MTLGNRPISRSTRGLGSSRTGYAFASPWLIGFFCLTLLPMIASMLLSFTEWNGINLWQLKWVGAANYEEACADPDVRTALWNTFVYSFLAVPLGLVTSLFLAVLLNQKLKGITFFRTVFYMPHVIGGVATIMMWMWVFNPDFGLLNSFLRGCSGVISSIGWSLGSWLGGLHSGWEWLDSALAACAGACNELGRWASAWEPPAWLYSARWSKPALIIMSLWGAGGSMLIFLAALQNVPEQLYEAAKIDGAGRWSQFAHVTLPQISPAIFFNLVMGIIGSFQVFNEAYIMTNGDGGPSKSLLFYVLHLYNMAFRDFRMGYASALAWILFCIILVFTLLVIRSSRAWVYYEGEKQ